MIDTTLVSSECQSIIDFPSSYLFELPSFFDGELTKETVQRDIVKIVLASQSDFDENRKQHITMVSNAVATCECGLGRSVVIRYCKQFLSKHFLGDDQKHWWRSLLFDGGGGGVKAFKGFFVEGYFASLNSLSRKIIWLFLLKHSYPLSTAVNQANLDCSMQFCFVDVLKKIEQARVGLFSSDTFRKSFKWLLANGYLQEIETSGFDDVKLKCQSGYILHLQPRLLADSEAGRRLLEKQNYKKRTQIKMRSNHFRMKDIRKRVIERESPLPIEKSIESPLLPMNTPRTLPRDTILRDKHEKRGYDFRHCPVNVKFASLAVGDYAIEGCPYLAVERKSIRDLNHTLSRKHLPSFKRELIRASKAGIYLRIIVEGKRGQLTKWSEYIVQCLQRAGIIIDFAGSRAGAEQATYEFLSVGWGIGVQAYDKGKIFEDALE